MHSQSVMIQARQSAAPCGADCWSFTEMHMQTVIGVVGTFATGVFAKILEAPILKAWYLVWDTLSGSHPNWTPAGSYQDAVLGAECALRARPDPLADHPLRYRGENYYLRLTLRRKGWCKAVVYCDETTGDRGEAILQWSKVGINGIILTLNIIGEPAPEILKLKPIRNL
jgi:hypothetical protein